MNSVSVVIVLYNCDVDIYSRIIEPLRYSVQEFVVISNSGSEQPALEEKLLADADVIYIRNGENLGIAKAQNIATLNSEGEYILFFDQDSRVEDTFVNDLVKSYEVTKAECPGLGLLSALDYDECSEKPNIKRIHSSKLISGSNVRSVSNTLSSGSLILRNDFLSVGGNLEWLFIDQVDNDLCYRLIAGGKYIAIDTDVRLLHNLGEGKGSVLGVSYGISSPFRNYYQVRNMLYLSSKKYVPYSIKFKLIRGVVFKFVLATFVLDSKLERLKYMTQGVLHGFRKAISGS